LQHAPTIFPLPFSPKNGSTGKERVRVRLKNSILKEAYLFKSLPEGLVRCNICQRRCVIKEGEKGWCKTRLNQDGKLYSLIYSKVSSVAVSPIEKKPLFHFYPGSNWLSLGTLGCNFRCPGCQNWEIAHSSLNSNKNILQTITPRESIKLAKEHNCKGISWTYNEPTIWFEYTLDSTRLARQNSLLTNYVTNGYITPEAIDLIGPYLDSFRVDLKGFTSDFYKQICHINNFEGILEVTKRAKDKWGMHVEIITNITPGYNDDDEQLNKIAAWIVKELGEDTPWHLTRFIPHLDLKDLNPTPISTLEKARELGFSAGLRYVYLGNVPGNEGENTLCHNCKKLLIKRYSISILENKVKDGKCPYCGSKIPGRF